MGRIFLCWSMLLLLLAGEIVATQSGLDRMICALAVLMVLIIVIGFMKIFQAPSLAIIFAVAGLFWLGVLLMLGSLDSFTRTSFFTSGLPVSHWPWQSV
ncbi:hypothetical protein GOB85_15310 [Acetobacter sp. LMG 1636]|uniref:Uncharacterized protein n=2 Tax=Acetobacter fallax TaxID=1737473 RepID=A0ABX0KBX8_9PROT|nr:hypothetical protein [Acetobacter fallax]NHO37451.1 hypothetical protein [Acetobacter fallax]